MNTYKHNGKLYRVFSITAFNRYYNVIVTKEQYLNGKLALMVLNLIDNGDFNNQTRTELFGMLTTNISSCLSNDTEAFVKTYSENEEWAEDLAVAIGGIKENISVPAGYEEIPLYDFNNLNIYADENSGS